MDGEGIVGVVDTIAEEGRARGARGYLTNVVEVVGALAAGTIGITIFLESKVPHEETSLFVAIATGKIVASNLRLRLAQFCLIRQSHDKASQPHVETRVSIESLAVSFTRGAISLRESY